jgi:peptidoglycan/LPS O-acetylase OafA/YrhL
MSGSTVARSGVTTARYDDGRRIVFLDCVRGLAASLVVLEHCFGLQTQRATLSGPGSFTRWSLEYMSPGRVGVVAFFLVSGYVIPLSLERQSLRTFCVRRFFRLYPVYWIALAAYVAVAWSDVSHDVLSPPRLVLNLLMVQGAVGAVSILPPGWTLGIELVFYAQSAAAAARRWLDRAMQLGWVWLASLFCLALGASISGRDTHPSLALFLLTAALGHSLYLRDRDGSRRWRSLLASAFVIVPVSAVLGEGQTPAAEGGWQPISYALSWALGVALFGVLYALRHRDLGRALTWLGSVSYSVYLVHPTVFAAVALLWSTSNAGALLVGLAAVPFVAWALHVALERPAIAAGRRLSRARRTPPLGDVDAQAAP